MVTKAERERKDATQTFRNMMDQSVTHLRVGQGRGDGSAVRLLGYAHELHGLDGVCTCCPRRPAGEPTAREVAAAAARAVARRRAELGPARPSSHEFVDSDILFADELRAQAIAAARAQLRPMRPTGQ